MSLHLVSDVYNWHRWRSVQFGVVGAAFGASLTAYGAARAISPTAVSSIPHWVLTALTVGAMLAPLASMIGRVIDQPNLPAAPRKPSSLNHLER